MDSSIISMITAGIGVGGTLAASALGQVFGRRSERDRRKADDQSRWLSERLRIATRVIGLSHSLERKLWDLYAFLDEDDGRSERLPGYTTILVVPDSGIEGIIEEFEVEFLATGIEAAFKSLNEIELQVTELSLIATPREAEIADQLVDALLTAVGAIEAFLPAGDAARALHECRNRREALIQASRQGLRVDASPVQFAPKRNAKELERAATEDGGASPHSSD